MPTPPSTIDESRLDTDVEYRFAYVAEFLKLTDHERALVRAARPALRERLDTIVGLIGDAMLARPEMVRHFVSGDIPPDRAILEGHLRSWIEGLVSLARDPSLPGWMDRVGAAHRAGSGDPTIDVPRVQMNALLGLLSDLVFAEIARLDLPAPRRFEVARAFSKLLWLQNDMIQRHY